VSDDHKEADTETEIGGIQPDALKLIDKSEGYNQFDGALIKPIDFEDAQDNLRDEEELKRLFAASTIQEGKEEIINHVRERTNRHWSKEAILDEVESKFQEVFSK